MQTEISLWPFYTHFIKVSPETLLYLLEMLGKSEDILGGFRVNWMNLRDADTGKILWQVINYCIVDIKKGVKGESLLINSRATMTFQFRRMSMRQGCQRRF